jgi:hypothetical protein
VSVVVTFVSVVPPARYDAVPWALARIEESTDPTADPAVWTEIDTYTLSPVDPDPAHPAARSFSTSLGSAPLLWYRLIWEDGAAAQSDPTTPLQNGPDGISTGYASIDELARLLKIRDPSAAQRAAMARAIGAARIEIDDELDRDDDDQLEPPYPDLVVQVNLDRATELWQQEEATLGFVGIGAETGPARIASNTWDKHAHKLQPLKQSWGIG